jgi:pimeloyl-ACP methyl ester carboxylesterase
MMEALDLPEGVGSEVVATPRLATHRLTSGPEDGIPVVFLHGNASSSRFFGETLAALASPSRYRGIAPDLRGFGDSEDKPLDATRGLGDFSDDMHDLALSLGLEEFHLVGWSAGGTVAMRYTMDHPGVVSSLVLVDPMSPYGFGGTTGHRGHTLLAGPRRLGRRDGQPGVRWPARGERPDRDRPELSQERDEQLLLQTTLQGGDGGSTSRYSLRRQVMTTTRAT